jgi:integrase
MGGAEPVVCRDIATNPPDGLTLTLKAIFEMAEADQLVTKSPANGLVMPRCKEAPPKRTITADDVLRSQMVLPIRDRLIFRLAVCEGMRPGEIVGLQVGDFHENGTIHVNRRSYAGRIDTPKSRRSRRVIPATGTTKVLMQQWVELLKDQRSEAWMFPSETDQRRYYTLTFLGAATAGSNKNRIGPRDLSSAPAHLGHGAQRIGKGSSDPGATCGPYGRCARERIPAA